MGEDAAGMPASRGSAERPPGSSYEAIAIASLGARLSLAVSPTRAEVTPEQPCCCPVPRALLTRKQF